MPAVRNRWSGPVPPPGFRTRTFRILREPRDVDHGLYLQFCEQAPPHKSV